MAKVFIDQKVDGRIPVGTEVVAILSESDWELAKGMTGTVLEDDGGSFLPYLVMIPAIGRKLWLGNDYIQPKPREYQQLALL